MRQQSLPFGWYVAFSICMHVMCVALALYIFRVGPDAGDVAAPVSIFIAAPELPATGLATAKAPTLRSAALPSEVPHFTPAPPTLSPTASVAMPVVTPPLTPLPSQPLQIDYKPSLPDISVVAPVPELTSTVTPQAVSPSLPAPTEPPMAPTPLSATAVAPPPAAPVDPVSVPLPQHTTVKAPAPERLEPSLPQVARLVPDTLQAVTPPVPPPSSPRVTTPMPQPSSPPTRTTTPEVPLSPQVVSPLQAPLEGRRASAPLTPLLSPPARQIPQAAPLPALPAMPPEKLLPMPTLPPESPPQVVPPLSSPPSPSAVAAEPAPVPSPQSSAPQPRPEMVASPPLATASPGPSIPAQAKPPGAAQPDQATGEAMPRFAYKPCPQYPYVARRRSLEGTVLLRVQMLANGTVGTVEIAKSSGSSALDDAAQRAVQKWTHTPENGNHAPHWVQVPVNFRLQRGDSPHSNGMAAAALHLNCDP